jgi:predicted permease
LDSLIFSVDATFPIFLTMLVGMLLRRLGLMDQAFTGYLNSFVFKVALPVLLFQDLATQDFAAAWDGRFVLFCFLATAASMAGIVLLSRVLVRDLGRRGEFVQASYRSSAAILGIAFIQSIYGSAPSSMAALMILGSVPLYNVFAVVVLTLTAEGGDGRASTGELARRAARGVVTNPIIIGIAAGFAWSLLGLPMPVLLGSTVRNVAVLATPLGLISMGASFDLRAARGGAGVAAVATLIKLVVLVAVFMPVAIHLGFRNQQLVALLVMLGSASTVSCYIMARNMGHDGVLTSTIVMMTTLGCALTLTGWLWLLRAGGFVG